MKYNFVFILTGCKATIVARNGTISSPAFGLENYPSNQECLYKIRNPGGQPLSLNFGNFDVDKSDFVQVFDGPTTSGLRLHSGNGFSSEMKPKITLTASTGEMLVRFMTDALHNNIGWEATFSAGNRYLKHSLMHSTYLLIYFRLSSSPAWSRSVSLKQRHSFRYHHNLQLSNWTRIRYRSQQINNAMYAGRKLVYQLHT